MQMRLWIWIVSINQQLYGESLWYRQIPSSPATILLTLFLKHSSLEEFANWIYSDMMLRCLP